MENKELKCEWCKEITLHKPGVTIYSKGHMCCDVCGTMFGAPVEEDE